MEQYLYEITPSREDMLSKGSTPEEDALIEKHFYYLKDLYDKGIVRLAGRTLNTDPSSHGLVIFEAEDRMSAEKIMEDDPAVKAGVFTAKLFPFRTALGDTAPGQ